MSENKTGRAGLGISGAVLTGLLLVPATAIAAVAIVATTRPPAVLAEEITTTTSTTTTAIDTTTTTVDGGEAIDEACTDGAEDLIEKEQDQSISEIEAAALDALREVCAANGMTVAGPPVPDDVVRVVTRTSSGSSPGTTIADDEYEDHDDDDYGDHDDDEDHEDHEDDDDEDHEDHEDEDHEDEDHEG